MRVDIMKESNYNYFYPIEDEKCLAYNCFTNGLAVINLSLKELISEGKIDEIDEGALGELKKGGFIVQDELNELDLLKIRFRQAQFNNSHLSMTIAPSTLCNMACKYCFETLEEKEKNLMSQATMDRCFEYIKKCLEKGAKSLHITWFGGEPLLHPDIIEELSDKLIKHCDTKEIEYTASVITNGTLLNEKNSELLYRYKVQRAQVTIDGPENIHNERRPYSNGKGTFLDILNNLEVASKFLLVNIRVNVDNTNISDAHKVLSSIITKPWFDSKKIHIQYGHVGKNTDSCKCHETDILDASLFQKETLELNKYIKEKGANWNYFPATAVGCVATTINNFLIGPKGELYKCWNHFGDKTKIVGTIFEDEVEISSFYLKYLIPGFEEDEECLKCKFLPLCMGGCIDLRRRWEEGKSKSRHCSLWRYHLQETLENFYKWQQGNK